MNKSDLMANLIGNAIDFLNKAIGEFDTHPKYSIINFYTAIELFMKARLLDEHWSLVVSKNPDWEMFIKGDFVSVTFEECTERLKKIANSGITDVTKKKFDSIRKHRNKMVHFFHTAKTSKKEMEVIVGEQLSAWCDLHKIMLSDWNNVFAPWAKDFAKIERKLKSYREYLQAKFDSLSEEIKKLSDEGIKFKKCSSCGFKSSKRREILGDLEECTCLVCDHTDKYLIFTCPECEKKSLLSEGGTFKCKCGHTCDESQLVDALNEDPATTDNYFDHPLPANCGACDGYHTVVSYQDKYLCVSCLDVSSDLEHCSWCGEANTGDMDMSEYSGCGQCDGNTSWHKDD
jgi:hypothetical protein